MVVMVMVRTSSGLLLKYFVSSSQLGFVTELVSLVSLSPNLLFKYFLLTTCVVKKKLQFFGPCSFCELLFAIRTLLQLVDDDFISSNFEPKPLLPNCYDWVFESQKLQVEQECWTFRTCKQLSPFEMLFLFLVQSIGKREFTQIINWSLGISNLCRHDWRQKAAFEMF